MATFSQTVTSSANEVYTGGGTLFTDPWNYLGDAGGYVLNVYCRFTGVTIPNAATITSATLTLRAGNNSSGTVACTIGVENADNSAIPSNGTDADSRSYAGSSANWSVPNTTQDVDYVSSDFSTSVQSLVNRAGWASGNALLVMLRNNGSSSYRTFRSYDTSQGAKLDITYTDPASGQPVTVRFNGTPGMRLGGPTFGRGW